MRTRLVRQWALVAVLLSGLPTPTGSAYQDSPEGVKALVDALKDRDPDVRKAAAQSLGRIGRDAKAAVPALAAALDDAVVDVRGASALALGRVGPDARDAAPALARLLKDKEK